MTVRESLGHYEILGPIGAGGMGEVYVARDPKLGRRVAIKLLPLRLAGDRDTLSRFTQEARSASALNHPNIVTIHEVGAHEGTPFIVMEYVEGHDLRSLIADGPLPVRKLLDIAVQIADGLAAAHERGIVHRDLKPENIMITRDGYVKILDFGLAKIVSPSPDSQENTLQLDMPGTNPGTILGTVGYMSPEQATGKRLDFRSDQFAFGAILYELATGRAAFEGETAIDTLSAILHNDPPIITKSAPRAPAQLADMIRRLLEKSPDDRYSSARDLAREIRVVRDRVAAEESGYHQSQPSIDVPKKTTVTVIAAIALAVFLAGAMFMAKERRPAVSSTETTAPAPAPTKFLAVMRFQDLTNDPNGALVVDGFAETLTARLAHYPNMQVMRPGRQESEETDPRKVARFLGANLVLTGSMMRQRDTIRVTYRILDTATGREWSDLVTGSVSDLFGMQDEVAERVARQLNLGASPVQIALDPAVSQQKYLEAIGHMRRYDDVKSLDAALAILQDLGSSPSVQAALARAYLHKFQITRDTALAASAGEAAELALKSDPQSIDVNVTLGELRRRTGRYEEAQTAFLRVLSQQPTNFDAVLGLAMTYRDSNDPAHAEETFKRAIALQPNYWAPYNHLAGFYYGQARYAEAATQWQQVVRLAPDSAWAYNNLGAVQSRLGRYDEAVQTFRQSVARKPTGQGYSNLGTTLYFAGQFAAAAEALEQATALTPEAHLYWRNLGDAYRWIPGKQQDAQRSFERAIALCDKTLSFNAADATAHASRASALAKLRRQREARAAILRALELKPSDSSIVYEAAVIANVGGDEEEALARIEQAVRLKHPLSDFLRDPEFANLRKSGSLQAAIQGPGATK
ncbi:MAG TPA: protein kinase [Thermoanaerobaculia bacterium]|nr:protein kinase [Thermoanaerobaculia bacterium]